MSVLRVASARQGSTRMKEGTVCPRPSVPVTMTGSSSSLQTSSPTTTPCGKCSQPARERVWMPGRMVMTCLVVELNREMVLQIFFFSSGWGN